MAGPWEDYATTALAPWLEYASAPAPKPDTTSMADRFAQGLRDPINGGAQLLTKILPNGVVDAGNAANNWLADKTGLFPKLEERGLNSLVAGGPTGVDKLVRDQERAYEASRGDQAGKFDAWRIGGNVLNPANLALAARLPQAVTTLGRIGVGAAGGAASAALNPVTSNGDFADEKLKQMAIGSAFGGAVPAVMAGAARVVSPKASQNTQLQMLKDEGVSPTVGQTLGGRWNALEEKAQSIPIMGDAISLARRRSGLEFEAAAHNRALAPLKMELPKGVTGRDAVNFTETALSDAYETTLNKIGAITPDKQFAGKVSSLQKMVDGLVMPKAEKAKFASALSDLNQSIDANGVMTPQAYKALESSLGTDARKLASSQNIYEGKLAPAVEQLKAELKDMLQRQAGPAADELKAVNKGWANFKRVQNAAAKVGAEDGSFSSAQYLNAVRAVDKSKDKAAFARGDALGQDLGDAGKNVLGNKVPNSFTTDRALVAGGGLGAYFLNPMIPAGLVGAGAMYTRPMQNLLTSAITARPQSAQAMADALRKASPALVPLGAEMGLGLLQ